MFEKIRGLSDPTISQDQEKELEKKLTPHEKKELKIIKNNIQKIEIKKQELIKKRDELLAKGIGNYDLEEAKELIQDYQAIKKENEKLIRQKDKILGIYEHKECEELKFEVKKDYFEKETREDVAIKEIFSISSFDGFVLAGREEGYFTFYQADKKEKKMKIVSENIPKFVTSSGVLESKMTKDYLAIAGGDHDLKIYPRTSKNPEDWFKNEIDLSANFVGRVSGLDLSSEGLVGAGSWKSEVLVYNLKNNSKILNQRFSEVSDIYAYGIYTFKFITQTDYAVIAGGGGAKIINYKNGRTKWEKLSWIEVYKAVAISPDQKEIAFTNYEKSKKVFFLDISDIENLGKNQEIRGKRILDEDGNPTELHENWLIHYTSDKKYLVISSRTCGHFTIINRKTMKIVKKFNFGNKAIVDQKGNIITPDTTTDKQLVYIEKN